MKKKESVRSLYNTYFFEKAKYNFSEILKKDPEDQAKTIDKKKFLELQALQIPELRKKIEIYLASFEKNEPQNTPPKIKKRLLEFFPEIEPFFDMLEKLYPEKKT